jgi:hypothetical protein
MSPASERQLALIELLAMERGIDLVATFADRFDLMHLTGGRAGTASAIITEMIGEGRPKRAPRAVPDPGIYKTADEIFRVRISKHGNWYAQRLTLGARRPWEYLGHRVELDDAVLLNEEESEMVFAAVRGDVG